MSEEEDCQWDQLWVREPAEDTSSGVGEQVMGVLDVLEFIEEFGRCAVLDAVAIVSSGHDESVDQGLCSR